jgi:hypothetical protein
MPATIPNVDQKESPDPRWRDLYRLGFLSNIAMVGMIVLAIAIFFVFGFMPGFASIETIFAVLQRNRLEGLMSIELQMILAQVIFIPQALALYVALKRTNESYALLALVLDLLGVVLLFSARPVVEMSALSDRYAAAANDVARSQYLAAGEALNALFNGTGWMIASIFQALGGTISSLLMFRSRFFGKATAWTGLVVSVAALWMPIPVIGPLLGLIGTIGGVAWFILLARDFRRLDRLSRALPV